MVAIDQFLEELCSLRDFRVLGILEFCGLFFSLLTDIHLIFCTWLCHTKIQIKFQFGFHPLIFDEVMALGLRKKSRSMSFPDFFRYSFDIWYMSLPYQDTDKV
jgi:hypothetical protein